MDESTPQWEMKENIILYEEMKKILTIAVCRWTSVPIIDQDIDILSEELADMFESAEKIDFEHIKGKHYRKKVA